ncbi:hypothetical protein [Paraglaciecola sp. 20A4]|uniref:hypothetical protein n=1 Tax=Paraglaciecola sp. 20A4 TaxID=2687288 RepID=UPI00140B2722|nr:hypothetical protein [Paraglaciecola sp. 20A4]
MNRSSKGFGLAGVLATVVVLILAAIFSTSANSQTVPAYNVQPSANQNNALG